MNEIRPTKMKFIQNNTMIGRMFNGPMKRENMADYIPAPTISEILREEFMEPMNVSAYRLAKEIHVPVSRVQAILKGTRKITAYFFASGEVLWHF